MEKHLKISILTVILVIMSAVTVFAAEFSQYWYQDGSGNWHIKDGNGKVVSNAWLCDDAVPSNGKNIWYLIDANGNMVSAGLVKDGTGNYYSLEMNHDGHFGMLRYESKTYTADGLTVNLSLESSHNGSFAAIKNSEGREALQAKYGVKNINIDNSNILYTSKFGAPSSKNEDAPAGITMADFVATGSSVTKNDIISYTASQYANDAATYFYYDSSSDPSREGVVKTARGITLASNKSDVIKAYGNGKAVDLSNPAGTKAVSIVYGFDPNGVTNYMKSCLSYYTADGKYAIYFGFKADGQISYIIYYIA